MNRNRGKQSRFGPPNNYGSSSPAPLMDLKTGRPRAQDDVFSQQDYGRSATTSRFKTPEQLAFGRFIIN